MSNGSERADEGGTGAGQTGSAAVATDGGADEVAAAGSGDEVAAAGSGDEVAAAGSGDEVRPEAGRRRRSRIPLVSAIVVGCLAALLVAVLATSKDASTTATNVPTPLLDKEAPNITGPMLDGGSASLSSYQGKWVLVDFFASWCVPCQQEQGELVKFQNANASDTVIFGVRFDDPDVGPLNQMMSQSGAHWPVVDDPNAKIDYSVTGPPESFLLTPNGIVLYHIVGPTNDAALQGILNQAKLLVTSSGPAGANGAPGATGTGAAGSPTTATTASGS